MTATPIQLTPKQKTLFDTDIVIGKDILELLANAMYVDPLTIYREYVQNAADAIDEARQSGVLNEPPSISISLDHSTRSIRIRDNGESIPNAEFVKRISAIGASHKRGTDLRGFRGVGRLSGLGYCQELIFRGKTAGDPRVFEVTWNSRALKEKMRDSAYAGGLNDIIREVVSYRDYPADDKSARFFEVEMRKVSRLKNDLLLNEQSIRSYLSQVAPVPFDPSFPFGGEIQDFLSKHGVRPPIHIELNDYAGPIYHRVRSTIEFNPKLSDTIRGYETIEVFGEDGDIAAFGWVADHSYLGAVPKKSGQAGIRLRAGNIQVGDESLLAELYPEPRFANWAIGDVHVCSKKIIPNGRRDDFEHSVHYSWLQGELSNTTNGVAHKIRNRSQQRQHYRSVQTQMLVMNDWMTLAQEGKTPRLLKRALIGLISETKDAASKEMKKLPTESDDFLAAERQLDLLGFQIRDVISETESHSHATSKQFSEGTETALLQALKVVLSNARSPKAGVKTALDIVAAVTGQ